jgi:hypothetical protein
MTFGSPSSFYVGVFPVHCRIFYPLGASSTPHVVTTKNVSRHYQIKGGAVTSSLPPSSPLKITNVVQKKAIAFLMCILHFSNLNHTRKSHPTKDRIVSVADGPGRHYRAGVGTPSSKKGHTETPGFLDRDETSLVRVTQGDRYR